MRLTAVDIDNRSIPGTCVCPKVSASIDAVAQLGIFQKEGPYLYYGLSTLSSILVVVKGNTQVSNTRAKLRVCFTSGTSAMYR